MEYLTYAVIIFMVIFILYFCKYIVLNAFCIYTYNDNFYIVFWSSVRILFSIWVAGFLLFFIHLIHWSTNRFTNFLSIVSMYSYGELCCRNRMWLYYNPYLILNSRIIGSLLTFIRRVFFLPGAVIMTVLHLVFLPSIFLKSLYFGVYRIPNYFFWEEEWSISQNGDHPLCHNKINRNFILLSFLLICFACFFILVDVTWTCNSLLQGPKWVPSTICCYLAKFAIQGHKFPHYMLA